MVRTVAVAVLIGGACYTDLRTQKIRNALTLPMMAFGALAAPWTLSAWWAGAAGVGVALAAAFLPWRGGAIKAGDVKMLMAAGALLGPDAAWRATLWTLLLGVPAGLAVLAWRGRLGNIARVLRGGQDATVVAHAPVVGAGIVTAMLLRWPGG